MLELIKENPGKLTKRKLWKRLGPGNRLEFEEVFYQLKDNKEFVVKEGYLYPKEKKSKKGDSVEKDEVPVQGE